MELLQLEYFYKIAHCKTLTQAAEELHVSQPSLSQMIRTLEREFQTTLFDHKGRYLVLNQNGEVFLKHCTEILSCIERLENDMQDISSRESLKLTIGIYAASAFMPEVIQPFQLQYPKINITIIQNVLEGKNTYGQFDLIVSSAHNLPIGDNIAPLLWEKVLLAVPSSHPLANRKTVKLKELEKESILALTRGSGLRDMMDLQCKQIGITPNIVLECDNPSTLRNMIQNNLGVSFFPEKTWKMMVAPGLKLIPIEEPVCQRVLYVSWPQNGYLTTATKLFRNHLVKCFSALDGNNENATNPHGNL